MKTTVNNSPVQAKSTPASIIGKNETGTISKVNNLQANKEVNSEAEKSLDIKPIRSIHNTEQNTLQHKSEVSKSEIKDQLKEAKPVLNLESTLKLVEELHRRKIQRDKLLSTIVTLEEFEVAQQDDAEETNTNHFQGCELTIQDDKRREFSTKNPYIIKKVAEYINTLCVDRLAEIESGIYIPA